MQSKEQHPKQKSFIMSNRDPKCCMCGTSEVDVLNLGEMKTCKGYNAHYYCLLLSTTIVQNGADDEGILGFLPSDIRKELIHSKSRVCHYCKKPGASVQCDNTKCKLVFHLPCGIKNKSSHQFHQEYKSHCHTHRPRQKYAKPKEPHSCAICYEMIDFTSTDVLWAPCCKKRSFFHRACLQQMALSAGYFFKCPICNDSEIFQSTMKNFGVFIPDRDASWELEPNAFHDLLYRHNECNAQVCHSKKGRNYNAHVGPWTIVLCSTCGSQGTHVFCSNLKKSRKWCCADCLSFSNKSTPTASQEGPSTSGIQNNPNSSNLSTGPPSNSVLPISMPSTSRSCPAMPITACENRPSSLNGSFQGQKRKRSASNSLYKKVDDVQNKNNTPSNSTISSEPTIVIDSDSDVSVIEEEEPAYKCLLAKDGKVLPVRTIVKQEENFLVQGDLNIKENPKPADGIMNIKISDVRSLHEPSPPPARAPIEPPPLTPAPNYLAKMNKGTYIDKRVVSPNNGNRENNMFFYNNEGDGKNGKNGLNLIDNQGNVFIFKEIMGYQLTKSDNKVVEDQNNQNAGNLNNTSENEIVVID